MHDCDLNMGKSTLVVKPKVFQCTLQPQTPTVCRVVLEKTTVIPANHEVIVRGKVEGPVPLWGEMVTMPTERFLEKGSIVLWLLRQ